MKTLKIVKLAKTKPHKNCNGTEHREEEEDRVYAKRISTFDLICELGRATDSSI